MLYGINYIKLVYLDMLVRRSNIMIDQTGKKNPIINQTNGKLDWFVGYNQIESSLRYNWHMINGGP